VGKVTDIYFTDADPRLGVTLTVRIDRNVNVPSNVQAYVYNKGFVGGAYLDLVVEGPPRVDPATGKPMEFLPVHGAPAVLQGRIRSPDIIPAELKEAIKSLAALADNINLLLAPRGDAGTTQPAPGDKEPPASLPGVVVRMNRTLDALYAVLGDEANQGNLRTSLANLSRASESAVEAMDELKAFATEAKIAAAGAGKTVHDVSELTAKVNVRADELADKLIDSAEKISGVMATIQKAATKMESGDGTAGKILNDPKLYNNLLEATGELSTVLKEFSKLVETWKEQGVTFHLK
jgi:phospholipid/cholesterol/gamma-HCH transport system substrate-binding protein